jgi:hypothetical protein
MKYYKEYLLKNGKTLIVRSPEENDAEEMINLVNLIDTESKYLTREPGEFAYTAEDEKILINKRDTAENILWTVAVIDNEIVGVARHHTTIESAIRHKGIRDIYMHEMWGMDSG